MAKPRVQHQEKTEMVRKKKSPVRKRKWSNRENPSQK
jgi:hypothetical protein